MSAADGSFSPTAVRPAAVAGLFYPAAPDECRRLAQAYLTRPGTNTDRLWMGGIVPHAGWICSGAIAGQTIATIAASHDAASRPAPDVVVVFGAVHTPLAIGTAALDSHGRWNTPEGDASVPVEIERKLRERSAELFVPDDRFHEREHAVEVELPLIQSAWPRAAVLPVEVPVIDAAIEIGIRTAEVMTAAGLNAVYLASSDLTHYGPNYGFAPAGLGEHALQWALQNDERLLSIVTDFAPERVMPEVRSRLNACGGGAIAAMMAACRHLGGKHAVVLRHSNSYQTLAAVAPQSPHNAVGYAAVVVG